MSELLDSISLKDLICFIVGIITAISIFVEKADSLPFKPWSHLLQWIGNALTRDIKEGLEQRLEQIEQRQKANNDAIIELDKKVDKKFEEVDNRFKEKQKDDDTKEAKRIRDRIMEFADSCRIGEKHTQKHFENIMQDYSDYEVLCSLYDIPNHFLDADYAYIEEVYQECLRENKFV